MCSVEQFNYLSHPPYWCLDHSLQRHILRIKPYINGSKRTNKSLMVRLDCPTKLSGLPNRILEVWTRYGYEVALHTLRPISASFTITGSLTGYHKGLITVLSGLITHVFMHSQSPWSIVFLRWKYHSLHPGPKICVH